MKRPKLATLLCIMALLTSVSYAQQEVHSGILHTSSPTEQFNLIKIHCDAIDDAAYQGIIFKEYDKYGEFIKSVDYDPMNKKIYIKYTNEIDANMLLGILERIAIHAYYHNASHQPVYYAKSGNEQFRR